MSDAIPNDDRAEMAAKFRLLGDESRLAILGCLLGGGEMNVGEVAQQTGRTPASVSKNLKLLAGGGILTRRKDGLQVFYRINGPAWEQVCRLVRDALREAQPGQG
jgi:ArsR family transcriptional regulator